MGILNRIKEWFKGKQIIQSETIAPTPTHQVDQRDIETRKRVRKAFAAQQEQMQSRALKAHDPSCTDVSTCNKKKCFKPEPDKIVSEPYGVTREDIMRDEISRLRESGYTNSMLEENFKDLTKEMINPSEVKRGE